MPSQEKNFFAGLEEIFARLLGLALTLIFFLIYVIAVDELALGWQQALVVLGIFWLVYETVSLVLFSVFRFFSNQKEEQTKETTPKNTQEQIEADYQTLPDQEEPKSGI
jgi:hypothetical protein